MALLGDGRVSAAILDVYLVDGEVTPVAKALLALGLPVLVQTGGSVPTELKKQRPEIPALAKPIQPERIVERLADLVEERRDRR
jgi:DNA-binding NtrC family response regulator